MCVERLRAVAEKATDEQMIKGNPEGVATHFEPADGPSECVHLLAQDFRSMMFTALSTTPVYADWILHCDMSSAFEHRKRALQVLQSTNPGRWVLKMPSDSVFIPWIFRTFPDARVIWTHRDPYAAFASSFSMRGKSRLIFNRHMDPDYMRCKWPLQLSLHLRRPLELARERPNAIYHLYYDDMMADPIGQMKQVYGWLGDAWTAAAESGMKKWLDDNPQGRFGKHSYSLSEWGFTRKELEPYFADYRLSPCFRLSSRAATALAELRLCARRSRPLRGSSTIFLLSAVIHVRIKKSICPEASFRPRNEKSLGNSVACNPPTVEASSRAGQL